MKSRRQSGRGGAAAAMVADGNHNLSSSFSGACITKTLERKDVEKNRRMHMKGLCQKLSSLVPASTVSDHHLQRHYSSSSPPSSTKDAATQLDQLDSAAAYIKQLKARIDDLKRRKQAALSGTTAGCTTSSSVSAGDYKGQTAALPVIEVRGQDGTLDVALATEAGRPFQLHEVIGVLEQEGADVVSASFSAVGDKIFYTVHSQALCPRIGLDAGLIAQRIRGLAAPAATVLPSILLT